MSAALEGSQRRGRSVAGPLLIVASVLFALRGFVFHPLLTNSHVDILSFWLPRFAFLGRSLAAGHVPLWNPFEMAGYRFAADPQSGWLYAPVMALFSLFNPGTAMRWFIAFNPMLAGLGIYAFCRREGLGRIAATGAGLSSAMIVATSEISISLPFAGALAWTPVALLGASGYRRAAEWSRRLAWLALGAFAWSQIAAAHMSHGLVMGTLMVIVYLVFGFAADVRAGRLSAPAALGRVCLFIGALPLTALPILYPHLSFIRSSSLRGGYGAVADVGKGYSAGQEAPLQTGGTWAGWPFSFAAAPGPYAGAVILLAVPAALRTRKHRDLLLGIGLAMALAYISTLDLLLARGWFQHLMLRLPFGDVYVHNPGRFRYVAVLAIPLLGAIGLQALLDDPPTFRRALAWVGAGAVLWLAVPIVMGGTPVRFALLGCATIVAAPALVFAVTRRSNAAVVGVIAVLAIELIASALLSSRASPSTVFGTGLEPSQGQELMTQPLTWPNVVQDDFLRSTHLADVIRTSQDRYLTYAPPASSFDKGYLFTQRPQDWPGLVMERGTLFGVRDVLGYNPVQLPRYWSYIRAIDPLPIFYNASVIGEPTVQAARILGLRYLIVPSGVASPLPGDVVATDSGYELIDLTGWEPRVSVVSSFRVAASPADALRLVTTQGFDPAVSAVLETSPASSAGDSGSGASATYSETQPEDVTIDVEASSRSIVVVRTAFDAGWQATVDGAPATVLPADYLLQGVVVGAGHHVVRLTYRDTALARGFAAGASVWLALLLGIPAARVLERRAKARTRTHQAV
jgi:hypothetical protein